MPPDRDGSAGPGWLFSASDSRWGCLFGFRNSVSVSDARFDFSLLPVVGTTSQKSSLYRRLPAATESLGKLWKTGCEAKNTHSGLMKKLIFLRQKHSAGFHICPPDLPCWCPHWLLSGSLLFEFIWKKNEIPASYPPKLHAMSSRI